MIGPLLSLLTLNGEEADDAKPSRNLGTLEGDLYSGFKARLGEVNWIVQSCPEHTNKISPVDSRQDTH